MKTFIFSALALGMMTSCANTDVEGVSTVDNGEPVAITLNTGVQQNVVAGVTRTPITNGNFEATILGWEGTDAPDYSTVTPTWNTSSTIDASKETTVTLDKYYNKNSATNTFMKACYPAGSVNGGVYGFTDAKEDGSVDILYAKQISGSRATAPTKGLEFNHMLTQIKFSIQAGDGLPAETKLKSITLNDSKIATGIDLKTDALEIKAPANLITVPGITPTGIVIPDDVTPIENSELMIAPTTGNTMELTVVTTDGVNDKTFNKVTVTTEDASFTAGTAYTVTLTFKEKISVNAKVSAWKNSTATGEVE